MVLEKCGIARAPSLMQLSNRHGLKLKSARWRISFRRAVDFQPTARKTKSGRKRWRRIGTRANAHRFSGCDGVAEILESMSPDFGRDLRSRAPTPKSKQTDSSKNKKRSTLSLAKTTDSSGNTVFAQPAQKTRCGYRTTATENEPTLTPPARSIGGPER
jgi:hypothetical protein